MIGQQILLIHEEQLDKLREIEKKGLQNTW